MHYGPAAKGHKGPSVENFRETPTKKSLKQIPLPFPSLQSICQCPKFPKRVDILPSPCPLKNHCPYACAHIAYLRILACFYAEKKTFQFGFQRLSGKGRILDFDLFRSVRILSDSTGQDEEHINPLSFLR